MRNLVLTLFMIWIMSVKADQVGLNPLLEKYSQTTVDQILQQGVDKIGDLDLKALQEQIKSIDFYQVEGDLSNVPTTDGRSSAYYLTNEVFASADVENATPEAIALLALHESLGALGYDDNDYQKSVILKLFNSLPSSNQESLLNSNLVDTEFSRVGLFSPQNQRGGSTGIGGGGDITTAWFKYKAISLIKRTGLITPRDLITMANIQFEPQKDPNQTELSLTIARKKRSAIRTFKVQNIWFDTVTHIEPRILVPTNFLELDNDKLWPLIFEALDFLLTYNRYSNVKYQHMSILSNYEVIASCGADRFIIHKEILKNKLFKKTNSLNSFIYHYNLNCLKETGHEARINSDR